MARTKTLLLLAIPAVTGLALLAACGDDDSSVTTPDAGGDQQANPPPPPPPPPVGSDGGDAGKDANTPATQVLSFDPNLGELPEGLTIADAGGDAATTIGFAPLAKLIQVIGGTRSDFASLGTPTGTFTLGMTTDSQNNIYVAVASVGGQQPTPGVYKIAAGGNTPALFATSLVPAMTFANGLDIVGPDLYITDSSGHLFKTDTATGLTTSVVSSAPELAGDEQDCKLGNGFAIGVNGIAHDANNLYMVNTDKGTFMKMPLGVDGGDAGAITVLKKDPKLCGADGLVIDKDGTFLVANNGRNAIQRVSADGQSITDISIGAPLDSPASLVIQSSGGTRKLLITNAAFGSYNRNAAAVTDAGGDASFDSGIHPNPALLTLPLAP